jgi:hypothetical protein
MNAKTEFRTHIVTRGLSHGFRQNTVDVFLERQRSDDGITFALEVRIESGGNSSDVRLTGLTVMDLQGLREALLLVPMVEDC